MPGKKRDAAGVTEDEEAFPRGGGSGLAPIVHKQLREDAYREAEAELFGSGAKGRGNKRRKGTAAGSDDEDGDEEDAFFRTLTAQDKVPKYAELLKFKSLNEGTKLWGAVTDVLPKELVVSLPHGLKGHVAYEDASDVLAAAAKAAAKSGAKSSTPQPKLSELFRVGQLVRCVVTGLTGGDGAAAAATPEGKGQRRKRVGLSLRVAKVNAGLAADSVREGAALPAAVKSIEDHGFLLTFGIKGTTGFLPKKEAPPGVTLRAGSLVDVLVTAVKSGGHAIASAVPATVAAAQTREWDGLNIGTLLPGTLVTARVRHVLSDGLIASFLTFFTGTVDPFHLGAAGKADKFSEGQRVKARILFVDAASKRVGLTLQRGLVDGGLAAAALPSAGATYNAAVVRRVDEGLGVLVELAGGEGDGDAASGDATVLGFAHISNISDKKIDKLEGRFRPGQIVAARVIGGRPMDGIAAVTLKPSALSAAHLSLSDVVPGSKVSGTVLKATESSLVVALTAQLRAVVPQIHMSDVPTARSYKKFKEGQKVEGRVLAVDLTAKRVQVTLKPALVDSKLAPLAVAASAVAGTAAHGVITGVQPYGVFVAFYNDLVGLVPTAEAGLPEGQSPEQAFSVGAVVRVRVTGVDPKKGRLRLSMLSKKKAAAAAEEAEGLGGLNPGESVWGTVTTLHRRPAAAGGEKNDEEGEEEEEREVTYAEVALRRAGDGDDAKPVATGRLEAAHLSDHPSAAKALAAALRVGARLDNLLVVQRLESAKQLRVTRKASLVDAAAAGRLPAAIGDLQEGATYAGYVASVAPDGVFVRFLGDMTGRAGLPQLADTFVSDPAAVFSPGQSVRAQVTQIDAAKGRFSLSMKRSLCATGDAAYLASYFVDAEAAAAAAVEGDGDDVDWASAFAIGGKVAGAVHGVRDYGILCDLEAHSDVVGIAAPEQTPSGAPAAEGAPVAAVVLDYSKKDGLVDLSLRPELLARVEAAAGVEEPPKKKTRKTRSAAKEDTSGAAAACAVGNKLTVTVELVKGEEGYAVVSLPEGTAAPGGAWLGFLATADFNQPLSAAASLAVGDTVSVTVSTLPGEATCGRLLLALPPPAPGAPAAPAAPKEPKSSKTRLPPAGTKTKGKVEAVHALHADVTLDCGARGRVYVTEVADDVISGGASPLATFSAGKSVDVVVLGRMQTEVGRRHGLLELSTKPSRLATAPAAGAPGPAPPAPDQMAWEDIKKGQTLHGFAQEVDGDYLWVILSTTVRGRIFLPLGATSPEDCAAAARRFRPGTPLTVTVTAVDAGKRSLDAVVGTAAVVAPREGETAVGVIVSVGGSGVMAQLAPGVSGRVALSDIHDAGVKTATAGLKARQFVKVHVLRAAPAASTPGKSGKAGSKRKKSGDSAAAGGGVAELSLRPSRGGACAAHAAAAPAPASGVPAPPETLDISDIKPGSRVAGYVKSAGPQGVFICLARGVDARIKLRQLSDDFVEDPVASYPMGSYVEGSVIGVEGGRVEMSLRKRRPPPSLEALEEGQVVRGRVKRIERFGVFVELDAPGEAGPAAPAGPTGLAHLSELADAYVPDVDKMFKVDQRVVARVLAVDKAAGRLSLGLKPSYLEGVSDLEEEEGVEGEEGPDFDDELQAAAAMGGSDDEEGGSGSGEESEEGSEESGSGSEDEDEDGNGEGEEPASDFDLDEELMDAEAVSGSESEEGSDSE